MLGHAESRAPNPRAVEPGAVQELLEHPFLRPTEYSSSAPAPAASLAALSMEQLKQLLHQVPPHPPPSPHKPVCYL